MKQSSKPVRAVPLVLTQSKGIVAGIRGDIFSCVFFFFAIKTRANYLYSHIISLQK